jgi:hypothetical protein
MGSYAVRFLSAWVIVPLLWLTYHEHNNPRHLNTYSRHQALLTRSPRQQGQAMRASMVWHAPTAPRLHTLQPRYIVSSFPPLKMTDTHLPIGAICVELYTYFLSHRYGYRLGEILQQSAWVIEWSWGETWSWRPSYMVELVHHTKRDHIFLSSDFFDRQVFPSYSSAQQPVSKDSVLARIREKRAALRNLEQSSWFHFPRSSLHSLNKWDCSVIRQWFYDWLYASYLQVASGLVIQS